MTPRLRKALFELLPTVEGEVVIVSQRGLSLRGRTASRGLGPHPQQGLLGLVEG